MSKPQIMYYHDGRHPHIYRYEPPMYKEEYIALVDELAGTPIDAISFCLGEGRTMLHDTKAGELLGHNQKVWEHATFRRAYQNAKYLIESGDDPLRIICERAHLFGIKLYPMLIVQRGGIEHATMRCSDFRKDNPHLEIGAAGDLDPDYPGFDGLNMKYKESQDERFGIIEEAMTDYPADGFELQLNHMPYFFHPNEIDEGRSIMTDWIGRVHEVVKRSGKDKELAIRLPDRIEDCMNAGLDPETWVKQGIVDVLIPEMFNENARVKIAADYSEYTRLVEGTECRVLGTVNSSIFTDRLSEAPISMVRATAMNAWDQGVDGLYVSEWFKLWPYESDFYEKLRELPYPQIMDAKDKYYFIPTTSTPHLSGAVSLSAKQTNQLPKMLELNQPVDVTMKISDDLAKWGDVERVHEVLLRLRINGNLETDKIEISLNGKLLPSALLRKINQGYIMSAPRYRVSGYWHIYKLDRDHWPVKGVNTITVSLLKRDSDLRDQYCDLIDVELETKYLKGKNFHRSYVDQDLGPYEHMVT